MRAIYTIAEWPDAAIVRVMPTGRGFDWIKGLVDLESAIWRTKAGSQAADGYWAGIKRDEEVTFLYTQKDADGRPEMPAKVIFSVGRFSTKEYEGTPYLVAKAAFHPDIVVGSALDTQDRAMRTILTRILARIRWFLLDVLELDIEHDFDYPMLRELRSPLVLSYAKLQAWRNDYHYKDILEAINQYRMRWENAEYVRRAFQHGKGSQAWLDAIHHLGGEPSDLERETYPLVERRARSMVFNFTGAWARKALDGRQGSGHVADDVDDAWRWWDLGNRWVRGLILALEIGTDGKIVFTVSEANKSQDLGNDENSPLDALLKASVIVAQSNVDTWIESHVEPGTELINTDMYVALGTGVPYLWRNEDFYAWAKQLGLR